MVRVDGSLPFPSADILVDISLNNYPNVRIVRPWNEMLSKRSLLYYNNRAINKSAGATW